MPTPWNLINPNDPDYLQQLIGMEPGQLMPNPQIDASADRSPASAFVGPPAPAKPFIGPPASQAAQPAPASDSDINSLLSGVTGHGKGEKISQTTSDGYQNIGTDRYAVDPDEFDKAVQMFRDMPEYAQQKQSINDMRKQVAMLYGGQTDPSMAFVRPLDALADSQTGSHTLEGLMPSLTPQQRSAELLKYADELSKRDNDLTKEARQGAIGLLSNTQLQKMMADNKFNMGIATQGGYAPTGQFMRQTEREGRHLVQEGDILNNVIQLLSQGNPSANPTIKTSLARYVEGTVRPQLAVIGQEGGDSSLLQGVLNRVERLSSGELTDEQVGQYKKELQAFLQAHNENVSAFQQRAQVMNSKLPQPLEPSELSGALSPYTHPHGNQGAILGALPNPQNIRKPGTKTAQATPVGAGPSGAMSFEQWKASQGN